MSKTHQAAPVQEVNAKVVQTLYVAFELSRKKWKLGFSDGKSARARTVTIDAQDWQGLDRELERARHRFGLEKGVRIVSCYEIGRESFWLHRALIKRGIENIVVDAASIEVNRRDKRAKTDRMDAEKLVGQLSRYDAGDTRVWSVVRIPDEQAEDARQLHREIDVLTREQAQHRTRMQSLLFTQGIDMKVDSRFVEKLGRLRLWDGGPLPGELEQRLRREYQRLEAVAAELRKLRKLQQDRVRAEAKTVAVKKIERLQQLRGIGMRSSWTFVMEIFGWRKF